jgi:hypothetical protein
MLPDTCKRTQSRKPRLYRCEDAGMGFAGIFHRHGQLSGCSAGRGDNALQHVP